MVLISSCTISRSRFIPYLLFFPSKKLVCLKISYPMLPQNPVFSHRVPLYLSSFAVYLAVLHFETEPKVRYSPTNLYIYIHTCMYFIIIHSQVSPYLGAWFFLMILHVDRGPQDACGDALSLASSGAERQQLLQAAAEALERLNGEDTCGNLEPTVI